MSNFDEKEYNLVKEGLWGNESSIYTGTSQYLTSQFHAFYPKEENMENVKHRERWKSEHPDAIVSDEKDDNLRKKININCCIS